MSEHHWLCKCQYVNPLRLNRCFKCNRKRAEHEQRWLKPSEVTEPGVYWVVDTGCLSGKAYVMTVDMSNGNPYERRYGQWLSEYPETKYFGPIQPPEYKGE